MLWESIQDNNKLENQWVTQAFSSIAALIKNINFKPEREKYLSFCFENLKKGNSVPQSLLLSLHILSTHTSQMGFLGSSRMFLLYIFIFDLINIVEDILNKYNKEYNFYESFVTDLERYINQVSIIIEKHKAKGQVIENKSTFVILECCYHIY